MVLDITDRQNRAAVFIFILLFIANSFLGWGIFSLYVLTRLNDKRMLVNWSIMSIVFVSLYNATKIPENDLEWYVDFYLQAGRMNFTHYLGMLNGGKEQLYQILVYLIHFLGGDNYHVYTFTISLITYAFLLRCLYLIHRNLNGANIYFYTAVFILCFFPYTFVLTAHIVRQEIASALILWLLLEYSESKKKIFVILSFATIFIHSSAILFIPFFFMPMIHDHIQRKHIKAYAAIVCVIIFMSFLGQFLSGFIGDSSSTLSHIAQKMRDGTDFDTSLSMSQLAMSILQIGLVFYSIYIRSPKKKMLPLPNVILNSGIILLTFILLNTANPEIQLRYNFYLWTFFSMYALIFVSCCRFSKLICGSLCMVLFIAWNFYISNISQWRYTCTDDYIMYTFFSYFNK